MVHSINPRGCPQLGTISLGQVVDSVKMIDYSSLFKDLLATLKVLKTLDAFRKIRGLLSKYQKSQSVFYCYK
jgi:hypothetical protein